MALSEFSMVPGMYILLYFREEEVHFFLRAQINMQQYIHKKYLNFCLTYYYAKVFVESGKKHKQEIQLCYLCYGVYNETKQHFQILICFLISMNVFKQSFPY